MSWFGPVVGFGAAMACCAATSAASQDRSPDWKAVMRGVDGVIVYCQASKDREYSVELCEPLSKAVVAAFDGSGLKAVHSGVVHTGVDVKPGDRTDPSPLKQAPGMASPLVIRLLLVGTRGSNPGVANVVTVSRPFRAAVEAGAAGEGLTGDLVVYETNWVAEGPRRKVIAFLVDYGVKRLKDIVASIRSAL